MLPTHHPAPHPPQAKEIVRKLNDRAPSRMCIEAGPCTFKCVQVRVHVCPCGGGTNNRTSCPAALPAPPRPCSYMIADGVVYLTLTERAYPRKLAYAYLADVHKVGGQWCNGQWGDGAGSGGADHTTTRGSCHHPWLSAIAPRALFVDLGVIGAGVC